MRLIKSKFRLLKRQLGRHFKTGTLGLQEIEQVGCGLRDLEHALKEENLRSLFDAVNKIAQALQKGDE